MKIEGIGKHAVAAHAARFLRFEILAPILLPGVVTDRLLAKLRVTKAEAIPIPGRLGAGGSRMLTTLAIFTVIQADYTKDVAHTECEQFWMVLSRIPLDFGREGMAPAE